MGPNMQPWLAAAALALSLGALPADAATVNANFTLSGAALTGAGLDVDTNVSSGSFSVTLAQGASTTINLFNLWTDEPTVDADDLVGQQLNVGFAIPSASTGGTISGTSIGQILAGIVHLGAVTWSTPLVLGYGNGGQLSILLSPNFFNIGAFSLAPGQANGVTISATITNLIEPAPVPLPAAGGLILLGVGGLAMLRRRKTP